MTRETYDCDNCGATVARDDAVRTETYAGLDPETWQTLCCPDCGARLQTVFVGREGSTLDSEGSDLDSEGSTLDDR